MSLAFLLWLVFSPVELFCTNHLVVFYYFATKKKQRHASEGQLKGILGYTDEAVVSNDFVGDSR
jgi:hypothetical protein